MNENFQLESPEEKTPPEKVCGNCSFFQPHISVETNRVRPSKAGRCGWKPTWKWPMAFRKNGYGAREQDPFVPASPVFKHSQAKTCECFAEKTKKIAECATLKKP